MVGGKLTADTNLADQTRFVHDREALAGATLREIVRAHVFFATREAKRSHAHSLHLRL